LPLTTAQIVRSRLNDPFRYGSETLVGDGTASGFKLLQGAPHSQISGASLTASVSVAGGWSATATAQFDITGGYLVFNTAIAPSNTIFCAYQWATFSDDELAFFTAQGGVPEATLAGVNFMLVNAAKRNSWGAPDGTTVNDSQILSNLLAMRSALIDEIRGASVGPVGDYNSWAETQQDW
jgi:hypothetical protein